MDIDKLSGLEFLRVASQQEEFCASATLPGILDLGERAPGCLEELGMALNTLSGAAGCRWGCAKGDHLFEYLLGRGVSTAHASFRLMMNGFYDESLALSRSIGELANLLLLFGEDASSFARWKVSTRKERLSEFSPMNVRMTLEKLRLPIGIDKERYSALCELSVHATPATRPNSHSPDGRPRLGAYFQPLGALVALNELSFAVGLVMAAGAGLTEIPGVRDRLKGSAVSLIRTIGGATVLNLPEAVEGLRKAVDGT